MKPKYKEYKHLDLVRTGKEVAAYWDEHRTFEKSITLREGHPEFIFYEGPPSANGKPGINQVMARAIKDIFCRYKTQKGFLVERKAGWDTHGLPVEISVEQTLGITKEDIGKKNALIADISLGVGVVSLAGAVTWALVSRASSAANSGRASVNILATSQGALATFNGQY